MSFFNLLGRRDTIVDALPVTAKKIRVKQMYQKVKPETESLNKRVEALNSFIKGLPEQLQYAPKRVIFRDLSMKQ